MNPFKYLKNDLPASIVVFFVALPLCLGIALASGAPLFSGLIAGIVGGIIVGSLSGSSIGVSGPAAGLAVIVLNAIGTLDSYEVFLLAVVIGGGLQLLLGFLKAGVIGYYFPSSVIKGMLTGIGIIIILKQIPHVFGYDGDPEGDFSFFQVDGENTFSEIFRVFEYVTPSAILIASVSLGILILWERVLSKKYKIFKLIQGPLVAVAVGILFQVWAVSTGSGWALSSQQLVQVPVPEDVNSFLAQFSVPDFSSIFNSQVWLIGATLAIVASLETLLCVEATDKLDPEKNVTPTNRELLAQGAGNIVSGMIGGLPITQVIVRSSANIQSGGKTKMSAIIHGFFLLTSVILIPVVLNLIPLAVLAAVLLMVGYKLAKPALFKQMFYLGRSQFVPFIVTVLGIVFTDLLIGIGLGLAVGVIVVLYNSYKNSHFLHIQEKDNGAHRVKMVLAEEVTFFNKAAILRELNQLPDDTYLELDVRKTQELDYDVMEILDEFAANAKASNIHVTLISDKGTVENPESYRRFFGKKITSG